MSNPVKFYRGSFGADFNNFKVTGHSYSDSTYDPSGIYFNYDTKTIFQSGVEYGVKKNDFDALATKVDNKLVEGATLSFNGSELKIEILAHDNTILASNTLEVAATNVKFTAIAGSDDKVAIAGTTVKEAFDSVAASLKTNANAITSEATRATAKEGELSNAIDALKGEGFADAEHKTIKALSDAIEAVATDIDEIAYTGKDAVVVTDKEISLKLATANEILSQDGNGLMATLSLVYDKDKKIKLVGANNADLGTIDAADFIKDSFLDTVELDDTTDELVFTWNTGSGKDVMRVDISKYIDTYTAGNGIEINGKAVSVKVDTDSEDFLSVGADGVKLEGVADAISAAVAALDSEKEGTADNVDVKVVMTDGKVTEVTVTDRTKAKFDAIDDKFEAMAWIDCGTFANA